MAVSTLGPDTKKTLKAVPGLISTVSSHDEDIKKIRKTLYGNGEPGMDENIRTIMHDMAEDKKRREWVFNATIGTALSAIVMLIINGVIYFFRILPVLEKLNNV
jgi:hypothetical protein